MEEARHLPGEHQILELLLEAADHPHLAIGIEQPIARELHGGILPALAKGFCNIP
jgi:hypothetical protein